jgi:hypothetical protein
MFLSCIVYTYFCNYGMQRVIFMYSRVFVSVPCEVECLMPVIGLDTSDPAKIMGPELIIRFDNRTFKVDI